MLVDVIIPSPGESVSEVEIATWLVSDGSFVEKDQEIAEIESDKATLSLTAEEAGTIRVIANVGEVVNVGSIVAKIDTDKVKVSDKEIVDNKSNEAENKIEKKLDSNEFDSDTNKIKITPLAKSIMVEHDLSFDDIVNGLRRMTSKDVRYVLDNKNTLQSKTDVDEQKQRDYVLVDRQKMSMLRKKISEKLVAVKNETAMLTTFNEINMESVVDLRKAYQKQFTEKHGVKLGFMSFFTKAAAIALQKYPYVNAQIDNDEIVFFKYTNIGIAVQTPKGLIVPVVKNAQDMSLPEIEKEIFRLAEKARSNKISIEDMQDGTFSITNGGVFGSLLSTPILNPPQCAILGMHTIQNRPVAADNKVLIKPMMNVALSYDHRLIDGKDSVGFLMTIKQLIEQPEQLMFNNKSLYQQLFDL